MRYNVKDITIFFHLLKNVNGIGGGFNFIEFKIYNLFMDRYEFEVFFKLPHLFILNQLKHDLINLK